MRAQLRMLVAAVAIVASTGAAVAAEIKVVTVGALNISLRNMAAEYEKTSGHKIAFTFTNPANLAMTLAGGKFDVIVAPSPPVEDLARAGQLERGTDTRVSRTGLGIAVRDGAPKPDISTPDAFRRTLMNARSIIYTDPSTPNGSGILTQGLLTEIGLLDVVKAKGRQSNLAAGKEAIAKGEFEMAIFNLSETEAPGVVIAGPVPAPLQRYTNYTTGVFVDSAVKDAGRDFIRFLASPAAAPIWKAAWLEPLPN